MTDDDFREIQKLVDSGDLAAAKDRLKTIARPWPEPDLDFREPLAEIYWRLGYAEMAGLFWYVGEATSSEIEQAIAAFEHSCGDHPLTIRDRVRLDLQQATSVSARVRRLHERVDAIAEPKAPPPTPSRWLNERTILLGCATALAFIVAFTVVGIINVCMWIYRAML